MAQSPKEQIVDTALALAAERSWEAVRLHEVATRLGVTLDDVRAHFREKDEIVDAWFDRADGAMLRAAAEPALRSQPPGARLEELLMRWFAALAPYRRVTREMIALKLEPGHVHIQFAGLLRVSRTVQWWREAAQRDAVLPWRAIEETALTTIYLFAFGRFLYDESPAHAQTRSWLRQLLASAERLSRPLRGADGPRAAGAEPDVSASGR